MSRGKKIAMWSCIGVVGVVAAMVITFVVLVAVDMAGRPDKFGNIQTSWTPLPASMPKDNRPFSGSFANACQQASQQEVQTYIGKTNIVPAKYIPQNDPVEGGTTSRCMFDFPGGSLSIFVSRDPAGSTLIATPEDDLKGDSDGCKQFQIVESYNAPMAVCVNDQASSPTGLDMVVYVSRVQNGEVRDAEITWNSYPGDPAGTADKVTPRLEGLASLIAQRM